MNDPYQPPQLELDQAEGSGTGTGTGNDAAPGAQASMVLGIVGLSLFVITCSYFAIFTLILSIIGMVLAAKAKRLSVTNPERFPDSGMRVAGFVCNLIGLILGGLWTVLVGLAIVVAVVQASH